MNVTCPKCEHKYMTWGNDWNNEDEDDKYLIWSQYICPKCETIVNIYWSEDGER